MATQDILSWQAIRSFSLLLPACQHRKGKGKGCPPVIPSLRHMLWGRQTAILGTSHRSPNGSPLSHDVTISHIHFPLNLPRLQQSRPKGAATVKQRQLDVSRQGWPNCTAQKCITVPCERLETNEDSRLLVHNTMSLDEGVPTFRMNLFTPEELTSWHRKPVTQRRDSHWALRSDALDVFTHCLTSDANCCEAGLLPSSGTIQELWNVPRLRVRYRRSIRMRQAHSTASMFVNLVRISNFRDHPILVPLFRLFATRYNKSGSYYVAGK